MTFIKLITVIFAIGLCFSLNSCSNSCDNCYLRINIKDTYGAKIVSYGISVGQATKDEMDRLKRGENVRLTTKRASGQNPSTSAPLHSLKVDCNKAQVIGSVIITVEDDSCPNGYRTYYLINTLVLTQPFVKGCTADVDLYLKGDFSDFDSYCL